MELHEHTWRCQDKLNDTQFSGLNKKLEQTSLELLFHLMTKVG